MNSDEKIGKKIGDILLRITAVGLLVFFIIIPLWLYFNPA